MLRARVAFPHGRCQPGNLADHFSLQYLSGLLAFAPGMARIVWQSSGHKDAENWISPRPSDAVKFRRALPAAAAKTGRRHAHFLQAPYTLTTLVDHRATSEYQAKVLEQFTSTEECCNRKIINRPELGGHGILVIFSTTGKSNSMPMACCACKVVQV